MSAILAVLRQDRWILVGALAALTGLASVYVVSGAGMGMSALDMTVAALFPHRLPGGAGTMGASWPVVVLMWWAMMIAMMTPAAAPLVLLYQRVLQRHGQARPSGPLVLLAGYLAVWLLFSVGAAGLQRALEPAGLLSGMMLWSRSALLSAVVLAAAGAYQFSPFKHACLRQCRGPAAFVARYWRPGLAGSFALGLRHGASCVGCCWLLMALLFVGGVMNVLWIAALMVLVLVERLVPAGEQVARVSGGVLLAWAVATLLM
jgi:predicted metal-binding membrane protein